MSRTSHKVGDVVTYNPLFAYPHITKIFEDGPKQITKVQDDFCDYAGGQCIWLDGNHEWTDGLYGIAVINVRTIIPKNKNSIPEIFKRFIGIS